MDSESLLSITNGGQLAVLLAGAALLLGLLALWLGAGAKRSASRDIDNLRQKIGSMGREVDEIRVSQFNAPEREASALQGVEASIAKYRAEKSAYDQIWPQLWFLHDRLGMFLRAVENGESAGDLRLEARNAALDARTMLNRNRPYCSEAVDELITRLIDTQIKVHLTACQHLDLLKETAGSPSDHERRVLRDKCHTLYEGEARDLMNRLTVAIRARVINVSYP
ncbi:hypothetical protein [Marinobacter apostichopi]|uniref:hypothetical protein n=1 Tax=Marinobacter apostichopi TaxID=3035454 RepID=UPI0025735192|nr:hypothetical protein [Marinobacter sp. LA51]